MENRYKVLDMQTYYRKKVYEHFTKDCKCSVSITSKINVTKLYEKSKTNERKFYINFLYCLAKAINSRDDYKMAYLWKEDEIRIYDKMNITHYVFNSEKETCAPVYTEYDEDYERFYERCRNDIEKAKVYVEYNATPPDDNYFDASYVSWLSYESLNVELPDGYLYFQPVINWGRFKEENGEMLMPLTVRLNHAVADGYLVSKVFLIVQDIIDKF